MHQYITLNYLAKYIFLAFALIFSAAGIAADRVLVFYKVSGFAHGSIQDGREALTAIAIKNDWDIELTDDSADFTDINLAQYNVVVWLNTTGNDLLNEQQKVVFKNYIENGGGYLGIHAAADAEYDWPWYGETLVGAWFESHPSNQIATINIEDVTHPATKHLDFGPSWKLNDEWYNYKTNPRSKTNVLMSLDESSYDPGNGAMGDHPITWYHNVGTGRAFYTGLGHEASDYKNLDFIKLLTGALSWAGNLTMSSDSADWKGLPPLDKDFEVSRIAEGQHQLLVLDIAKDGTIYIVGKDGGFFVFENDQLVSKSKITTNDKSFGNEGGLIGFVLDPNFGTDNNRFGYFHYAALNEDKVILSRIAINSDNTLNFTSEKELLSYDIQNKECCHSAGSMVFDSKGNLYVSTGDNTNPHRSDGYSPIDETAGSGPYDAQKSSSNTYDLRGKILRIKPTAQGGYTIPVGNLFGDGDLTHRPEIYTMGHRNPYRIGIDLKDDQLVWGEIGPDAGSSNADRGPAGHDELNKTKVAGNFGWPYFSGNNEAYNDYNFATNVSGSKFNPTQVVNNSPNNTGDSNLPNAVPAWITMGHRALMTSGVFRVNNQIISDTKIPSYFDGRMIYWNFNNDEMFEVAIDDDSEDPKLGRWLDTSTLDGIIDAKISPSNGHLYLIGWGASFGSNCCNLDPTNAGMLVEVKYVGPGDQTPINKSFFGINAGGNRYTKPNEVANFSTTKSMIYVADSFHSSGKTAVERKDIQNTIDQNLYKSSRWDYGAFEYKIPLDNNSYLVTLKFAETYFDEEDKRIFNVEAEGSTIISNLDVVQKAGANTAYDETHKVTVADGELTLKFIGVKENPMVSAIKIRKATKIEIGSVINFYSTSNNMYVGVNGEQLLTSDSVAGEAETFIIVDAGNGKVALKSTLTGKFVTVLADGTIEVTSSTVGTAQIFDLFENDDGSFSFKSQVTGFYVGVNNNGTLHANNQVNDNTTRFNLAPSEVCDGYTGGAIACRANAKAYLNMPKYLKNGSSNVPTLLSKTGVFKNVTNLELIESFIPFELIAPLWSDRAKKSRWVSVPSGTKVTWSEQGKWKWPAGTVLVKHFELPTDEQNDSIRKRLETRILVVREQGLVYGVSYKWNDNGTEAYLLTDSNSADDYEDLITISNGDNEWVQTWSYPNQENCLSCHNEDAEGVLGPKTASLNSDFTYPSGVTDNQLITLNNIGIFDRFPLNDDLADLPKHAYIADESKSLQLRMMSYWDSNCSSCHGPQGIAATWDARFEVPMKDKNLLESLGAQHKDYSDWYGLDNARIVDPGHPENSILYLRDKSTELKDRMPPLGRNLIDTVYIDALKRWIGGSPGLVGYYFNNDDFTALAMTRSDAQVAFNWTSSQPDDRLDSGTYAVRWAGKVTPETSGNYSFQTLSDDGVRVWIKGELVIDNWNNHAQKWDSSETISLVANNPVDIQIDYRQDAGDAVIELHWGRPDGVRELIPSAALSSTFTDKGLNVTFFPQTNFKGESVSRVDANIHNDWDRASPAQGIPEDNFSARWEGKITPKESGEYTFITKSDDRVRVWVNDQLIIDNWIAHSPTLDRGAINLTANIGVNIKVEFEDIGNWAVIELEWDKPNGTHEIVPMSVLSTK